MLRLGLDVHAPAPARPRAARAGVSSSGRSCHGQVVLALVQQVLNSCADRGLKVAPQLALEAVRLLRVNPDNLQPGAVDDLLCERPPRSLHDSDRPLRAACVRFLEDKQAPGLAATRMRVAFRRKYRTPADIAAERNRSTESRVAPLLAEVLDDTDGDDGALHPPRGRAGWVTTARKARAAPSGVYSERALKERLYGSVVAAAVLRSGLGSPADPAVIKDASAAMQSVYPAKELPHLLHLPAAARRAQLLEVCRISAGVRIFNWDCRGRQSRGLPQPRWPPVPSLVQEAATVTQAVLLDSVEAVESRLWSATAALETLFLGRVAAAEAPEPGGVDLELLKETVIYLRQQQVLLRRLLEDVEQAKAEALRLTNQLEAGLADVHAVVQAKTAVPSNQVYPQFMSLASTWEALETQAVVVSRAANLHRRLEAYAQDVRTVRDEVVMAVLQDGGGEGARPTDAERVSGLLPALHGGPAGAEAARRRLARDLERGDVAAQLEGFCPWFLAVSGGGLVPGCPALGLCESGTEATDMCGDAGRLYALSSLQAAELFSADPDKWIQRALEEVRRRPALVGLLGLGDELAPPASEPR
ncbi:hypothetical protein ONE63_009780 [Megalurothrips usitatus]|uniref:Cilia- and flagella-associated protein 206 n=1 Tax=Megalurothrips usitatus TaxID=439358 RepID=A0AAV7XFR0_9NEOP|nr:hypothetical protein ONE63_009780 [Megalurothrips usitatus]